MALLNSSSYDETDEDCLSPNLDEITCTEVIEDSSVEESTLSEGMPNVVARLRDPGPGPAAVRAHTVSTSSPGYVNLSSIYSIGSNERWANQQSTPMKNGYPEKKLPEKPVPPEKPVSLMMVNGKMDNRYSGFGGNNSFLYSHLLGTGSGARAKDPPSYTAATSGALFDKTGEKAVTSPNKSVKSPVTSPVNGVNKISDNYERAVAERLSPQREISRLNRSSLFSKVNTGVVSSKVKKNSPRNHDDDDDDYARDSDECSI